MTKSIYLGNVKGDKGDPGVNGVDGANGQDATINGMNAINITDGNGINMSQSGDTFTISADTDSVPTENSTKPVESGGVYNALANKANTSSVPTKTSDLTNDSGFITANDKVDKAALAENISVNPADTTNINIWIETT